MPGWHGPELRAQDISITTQEVQDAAQALMQTLIELGDDLERLAGASIRQEAARMLDAHIQDLAALTTKYRATARNTHGELVLEYADRTLMIGRSLRTTLSRI